MEEKTFSSEQSEEVIELLDIVDSSVEDETAVQAEEVELPAEAEREEGRSAEVRPGAAPEDREEGEMLSEQEPDADGESGMEDAAEKVLSDEAFETEEAAEDVGSVPSAEAALLEERLRELEQSHQLVVRALEERLAAAEKACAELSESVESLSQQIAQAGAMFLEDASVRLNMEEMVSRMLDARLPAGAEQEENGPEQALTERLDALERRMADADARGEQMAAAAAARVIRDEIAAMKAEAAGIVR